MKIKFAHTNIVSTDWKALVAFYVETFDCKIIPPIRKQSGEWLDKGTGVKNANLEGAHLLLPGHSGNGPTLEIYQYKNIEAQSLNSPNTRGFGHLAFEVDEVEEMLKRVLLNGGQANGEIVKRYVNGVGEITFVYVRDPEGNLIELQSWKKD
ncbi:VOC family protein [Croceivirga thetidis]|uniref:VOC family protein n=1 Tax=Croceivirga thetidis TaxID=2721623 RepID=A0ABX1GVW3_9FLAO|nr:VOC family protein [Croceivirga thetidis]NKI33030.1 VOC family protein [Croceivirga thetidis]